MKTRRFVTGVALGLLFLISGLRVDVRFPDRQGAGGRERVAIHGIALLDRPIAPADVPRKSPWPVISAIVGGVGLGSVAIGLFFLFLGRRFERPIDHEGRADSKRTDPDFGLMKHNGIDAWDCRVPFAFPHGRTKAFAVHVWADEAGPSAAQRGRFRQIIDRYESLWPAIAASIAQVHERGLSVEEIGAAMSGSLALHLGERAEDSVEFVVTLDLPDEGSRAYFLTLDGWEVVEAIVAE